MPDRKSRTRLCAPKPSATPATPALASNGPIGMPSLSSTVTNAMPKMTNVATLRSTDPTVSARWPRRSETNAPAAPASTRELLRSCGSSARFAAVAARETTRSIARCTSHRMTSEPSTMPAICSGVPSSQSSVLCVLSTVAFHWNASVTRCSGPVAADIAVDMAVVMAVDMNCTALLRLGSDRQMRSVSPRG
jgi:hypothetical protein